LFSRILIAGLLLVPGSASAFPGAQAPGLQLDSRIGPPVRALYEGIRDGQDWRNPYLTVCPDGVYLTVRSIKHESIVSVRDLRAALVKLPLEAWPYGRVIAIQNCSIVDPADRDRGQRAAEAEALLKSLNLKIEKWPS
jgi:hypothetical protein